MKSCWRAACAAALGLVGCIKVPPFQSGGDAGDDAAGDDGGGSADGPEVHWTADGSNGGTAYVTGFYSVHFASDPRFHFPDAIFINNVPVIGMNATVACNFEDEVGFAVHPAPRIAPHGGAEIVQNMLTPIWTGPAVVQIELRSQTMLDAWQPSIVTRFTFHPDGRTYRVDLFDGTMGLQTTPSNVSCDGGTPATWHITSFASLATSAGGNAAMVYDESGAAQAAPLASEITGQTDVCVDYGGTMQLAAAGLMENRFRAHSSTPTTLSLISDLDNTTNGNQELMTRTALFLSRGQSCSNTAGVKANVNRWQTMREMLLINQTPVEIQDDGIYGGFADNRPGGFSADFPVTIGGAVAMPFAVWLITPAASDITVTKSSPTTGPFYLKQHDASGQNWVIWFRDPLTAGDTITIDRAP